MFICGGHHDSNRMAVLVMVSKAESIVLYISSCIMYTCQNNDFLLSFCQVYLAICYLCYKSNLLTDIMNLLATNSTFSLTGISFTPHKSCASQAIITFRCLKAKMVPYLRCECGSMFFNFKRKRIFLSDCIFASAKTTIVLVY